MMYQSQSLVYRGLEKRYSFDQKPDNRSKYSLPSTQFELVVDWLLGSFPGEGGMH